MARSEFGADDEQPPEAPAPVADEMTAWPDLPHRLAPAADYYRGDAPVEHGTVSPGEGEDDASPAEPAPDPAGAPAGTRPGHRATRRGAGGSAPARRGAEGSAPARRGAGGSAPARRGAGGSAPARRLRWPEHGALPAALAIAVLAGAAAIAVWCCRAPDGTASERARWQTPSAALTAAAPGTSVVSAPQRGLRQAAFELSGDAVTVRLRLTKLDGALYRITTAAGATTPAVAEDGATVRVRLAESGRRGDSTVDIGLDANVRWSLRIGGEVRQGEIDTSTGRTEAIVLTGDAADLHLTLPAPDNTLPVRVQGGINRLRISVPRDAAVRVRTRGGAGRATVDGRTVEGLARNTSVETPEWRPGSGGVDVDAVTGLGALQIDRRRD